MVTQHHATFNFVKLALFTVQNDSWIATHSTVALGWHLHGISHLLFFFTFYLHAGSMHAE
jgi:hypothetical protein